ncbi:unnamed protein product, partial [marine sediment metagenome]
LDLAQDQEITIVLDAFELADVGNYELHLQRNLAAYRELICGTSGSDEHLPF